MYYLLQKFRTQGGEGFEAQSQEPQGIEDELSEAAQIQHGIDDQQKVSDSLIEAGFVKPMQHEDPNADQEQTARIGGRLVESGFGRLQFEDAMESNRQAQQQANEGIQSTETLDMLEDIIQPDQPDDQLEIKADQSLLVPAEPASRSDDSESQSAAHVADAKADPKADRKADAEADQHESTHGSDPHVKEQPETDADNRHAADLHDGQGAHVTEADGTVDLIEAGRTQAAEPDEELCSDVELQPAPREDLHVQNEASQMAAEVAELDQDKVL